MNFKITHKGD